MARKQRKAIDSTDVLADQGKTVYPAQFAGCVAGRSKRKLGDYFGLTNFGVNLTTLKTGFQTALLHCHKTQDEFVYVVSGEVLLICLDAEGQKTEQLMTAGMCVGFPKQGDAHHIKNVSGQDAVLLEVGDRAAGDQGSYPEDDLEARQNNKGQWVFYHKNGDPYNV